VYPGPVFRVHFNSHTHPLSRRAQAPGGPSQCDFRMIEREQKDGWIVAFDYVAEVITGLGRTTFMRGVTPSGRRTHSIPPRAAAADTDDSGEEVPNVGDDAGVLMPCADAFIEGRSTRVVSFTALQTNRGWSKSLVPPHTRKSVSLLLPLEATLSSLSHTLSYKPSYDILCAPCDMANVICPPLIEGGHPRFTTAVSAAEFVDVECWCEAPAGDPNFVSLKLRFVQGMVTQVIECLRRVQQPLAEATAAAAAAATAAEAAEAPAKAAAGAEAAEAPAKAEAAVEAEAEAAEAEAEAAAGAMRWAAQASAEDVETCRRFVSMSFEDFACQDYVSQIIGAAPSSDSAEWRERLRTMQRDPTAAEGKLQWWGHAANAQNITWWHTLFSTNVHRAPRRCTW